MVHWWWTMLTRAMSGLPRLGRVCRKSLRSLSDERLARCREIFHACSEHELNFWAMAASPRSDL
mgnify:CR=1 FL=1